MSLLSNIFQGVEIPNDVEKYSRYNAAIGAPRAVQTGLKQNAKVSGQSTDLTRDINQSLLGWLQQYGGQFNERSAERASQQSRDINAQAGTYAATQARDINREAINFSNELSQLINADASRAGAAGANQAANTINENATETAARLNNQVAVPAANQAASVFNQSATQDVLQSQAQMFGGQDQFNEFRDQVNQNIEDKLAGRVSDSTRRQLARRAISSGNTELGGQAVDDFYTGYLGLTSEQLQDQGQAQYQSLYGLYRQSVPLTSGAQLLPQYGVSASQASGQATQMAGQLTGLGSVSAQQLFGSSGLSANNLFGSSALNASQLYNSNMLNASQLYGTNSLSNETMFQTNSLPVNQLLGLTTISPAQGIALDLEKAAMSQRSGGRSGGSRARTVSEAEANQGWGWSGAIRSGGPGSGPGRGLRTGSLQGGAALF